MYSKDRDLEGGLYIGAPVLFRGSVLGELHKEPGRILAERDSLTEREIYEFGLIGRYRLLVVLSDGATVPTSSNEITLLTEEEFKQEVLEYELQR